MIRSLLACLLIAVPAWAAPVPKQAADARAKEIAELRERVEAHKNAAEGNQEAERALQQSMDRAKRLAHSVSDIRCRESDFYRTLSAENALAATVQGPHTTQLLERVRKRRIAQQQEIGELRKQIAQDLESLETNRLLHDLYQLALHDQEKREKQ